MHVALRVNPCGLEFMLGHDLERARGQAWRLLRRLLFQACRLERELEPARVHACALGVNPSGLVFMLVASGVNSSLLEFMLVAYV